MAVENCLKGQVFEKIKRILKYSKIPEDPIHGEDTLNILLRLYPEADLALQIAALGHDIERAYPLEIRIKREDFPDYDLFKRAHSENSARLLGCLLKKAGINGSTLKKVIELVRLHEFGGTPEADILKDADSLSFFNTNLIFYMEREAEKEVRRRAMWGLKRLSPRAKIYLKEVILPNRPWIERFLTP